MLADIPIIYLEVRAFFGLNLHLQDIPSRSAMPSQRRSDADRFFDAFQSNDDELADLLTRHFLPVPIAVFRSRKAKAVTGTKLLLPIPRETALKIIRLRRDLLVDGSKSPWQITRVPSQRHPDKTTLAVYLPRTLMQRLRRLAMERGDTVTTVVEAMVTKMTRDVILTPEDYEQIARETRAAQRRRSTRAAG